MIFGFARQAPAKRQTVRERTHAVAGRVLPLKITENARAKRLTLRIDAGGRGLKITVPPGIAEREVERFLDRHTGWLETRLAKLPDKPDVREGIRIPLRGVPHLIACDAGKRGAAHAMAGPDGPRIVVHGGPAQVGRRVADLLKREARNDIEPLAMKHATAIGKRPRAIRFKDTSSRWGSCSSDGNLSFSWRIMMAPPTVIDYLVAHEVAHLKEMNHGPKFWALCRELCPRTDEAKAWLKRNGSKLQAIQFNSGS